MKVAAGSLTPPAPGNTCRAESRNDMHLGIRIGLLAPAIRLTRRLSPRRL